VRPLLELLGGAAPEAAEDLLDEAADFPPLDTPLAADASPAPGGEAVVEAGPLRLRLARDRLTATLERRGDGPPTLADVRRMLYKENVSYGLIDEARIAAWLDRPAAGPLAVARGVGASPGRDARIELRFTPAGDGEAEPVRAGDVLAVKVPVLPGVPGRTVHGAVLPVRPARDVPLRPGRNVAVAPDGRSLVATTEGRPVALPDGTVSVFPVRAVPGHVGPATGDVVFPGSVRVAGGVLPGFRVECGSLSCEEIGDAQVEAEGDVRVRGGLIGARIRAGGTLHARTIRRCRIEVYGDVIVECEVADSEIRCSGRLTVLTGRIVDSRVVARRGIEAQAVGSERSAPCRLQIGVDPMRQGRLDELQAQLAGQRRRLRDARETLQRHEQVRAMRVQERAAAEALMTRLRGELAEAGGKRNVRQLAADFLRQEKRRDALLADEVAQIEAAARVRDEVAAIEREMRALRTEAADLRRLVAGDGTPVAIRVHGSALRGTQLLGRHGRIELEAEHRNLTVRERNAGTREAPAWRMVMA
jgi:uncharacterized protein (DUF342 family)